MASGTDLAGPEGRGLDMEEVKGTRKGSRRGKMCKEKRRCCGHVSSMNVMTELSMGAV